jgi:hypothetical protein
MVLMLFVLVLRRLLGIWNDELIIPLFTFYWSAITRHHTFGFFKCGVWVCVWRGVLLLLYCCIVVLLFNNHRNSNLL